MRYLYPETTDASIWLLAGLIVGVTTREPSAPAAILPPGLLSGRMNMHKFQLGQAVAYRPQFLVYAPRGAYFVTAKLPERDGELEYRIRSMVEQQYERVARESELGAITIDDTKPK